jgi:hypothetical protein
MLESRRPLITWSRQLAAFILITSAAAQVPMAELDALTPPGGQAGQSIPLQAHGSHLDEMAGIVISDPEVKGIVENGQARLEIPLGLSPRVIDIAVQGRFGLSNPRAFTIGAFAEIAENGDHAEREKAQALELDQTINGTASAAAIDWFSLKPTTTDPIIINVMAERIDSRMDPTLVLYNEAGREIERHHDMRGRDVTVTFTPPKPNQTYFIGLHDFLYDGGTPYFYRLTLTRELPAVQLPTRTPAHLPVQELASEPKPYETDQVMDSVPMSIQGTCVQGKDHEIDLLLENETSVVVEIFSDRLGHSSDFQLSVHRVKDDGMLDEVGEGDDTNDPVGNKRFQLGSRDPMVTFEAKAKTSYRLRLRNQFNTGGDYRLEVRVPKPDVYLIAAAEKPRELNNALSRWTPILRRGGTVHWEILALRRDGFKGPITVRAESLPEGLTAPDLIIGEGQHSGAWTITAGAEAPAFAGALAIVGEREIDGKSVHKEAHGANLLWTIGDSNNERWESRLTATPMLTVLAQETEPIVLTPTVTQYETSVAGKIELPFKVTRVLGQAGNFKTSLYGLPGLRKSPEATFDPEAEEVKLTLDLANKDNNKFEPGD